MSRTLAQLNAERMAPREPLIVPMSLPLVLELPWPPTANNLFRNVPKVGRVATRSAKRYRRDAGYAINQAFPRGTRLPVAAPVSVDILACPPEDLRYGGDPDNYFKAPLDALKVHGLLVDDSHKYIKRVALEWGERSGHGSITVRLWTMA